MRIKTWILGVLSVCVLFGGIVAFSAAGLWQTKGGRTPGVIRQGRFAGLSDPADIRGSYTLEDIAQNFGIPLEDLVDAFGVENNAAAFRCKDLETQYGHLDSGVEIGTGSMRYFATLYMGLPTANDLVSYLPQTAVDVLLQRGKLSPEQTEYLKGWTVELP